MKTLLEIAIDRLHKAGYRASPSNLYGEYIWVIVGGEKITIHHTELYSFLNSRSNP
jgi:hypothetical protein